MKNVLIVLTFLTVISLGILIDSAIVGWLVSLAESIVPPVWQVIAKVVLWTALAFFTGGPLIAAAFILSGMIKTTLEK